MKYIILGITAHKFDSHPDGSYIRVIDRHPIGDHYDPVDNLPPGTVHHGTLSDEGAPVEYDPSMERRIKTINGQEWYHVLDRNGNIIND